MLNDFSAKTLVVVADAATAKYYETPRLGQDMTLLQAFTHEQSREKEHELVTDHGGHYQVSGGSARGQYESVSAKEEEKDAFARSLAKDLYKRFLNKEFEHLVLVAAPQFYGMLNAHLDKQMHKQAIRVIEKDYTKLPEKELVEMLAKQA